jgi:hypothetical protein
MDGLTEKGSLRPPVDPLSSEGESDVATFHDNGGVVRFSNHSMSLG